VAYQVGLSSMELVSMWRHIPKDSNLHRSRGEAPKPHRGAKLLKGRLNKELNACVADNRDTKHLPPL
jgi:hypothetical protein